MRHHRPPGYYAITTLGSRPLPVTYILCLPFPEVTAVFVRRLFHLLTTCKATRVLKQKLQQCCALGYLLVKVTVSSSHGMNIPSMKPMYNRYFN